MAVVQMSVEKHKKVVIIDNMSHLIKRAQTTINNTFQGLKILLKIVKNFEKLINPKPSPILQKV